jgi:hypothetical protein
VWLVFIFVATPVGDFLEKAVVVVALIVPS